MKGPAQVLMTADTVGGVWTYAVELSRALAEHGAVVSLATMGAPMAPRQAEEVRQVPGIRVFESTFKLEWMQDPWTDVERAGQWLLELESRIQPDIVHLNGYAHGSLTWEAPFVIVAHSCVFSWWNAVHGEDPPGSWTRYRQAVRQGLECADVVAAVSLDMANALRRHYGFNGARVIYNGRRPDSYRTAQKEPFILAAGRIWDEAKNIRALDRMAGQIEWPVYIAGDVESPDGGTMELRLSRALGQLGAQEMREWLSRAGIFVSLARYEPFGLGVLEAALSGCPLVLSDIGTFRELWDGAAVFVPAGDGVRISSSLNALSRDASLREEYGLRARERAVLYNTASMADRYIELYRDAGIAKTARNSAETQCAL